MRVLLDRGADPAIDCSVDSVLSYVYSGANTEEYGYKVAAAKRLVIADDMQLCDKCLYLNGNTTPNMGDCKACTGGPLS